MPVRQSVSEQAETFPNTDYKVLFKQPAGGMDTALAGHSILPFLNIIIFILNLIVDQFAFLSPPLLFF